MAITQLSREQIAPTKNLNEMITLPYKNLKERSPDRISQEEKMGLTMREKKAVTKEQVIKMTTALWNRKTIQLSEEQQDTQDTIQTKNWKHSMRCMAT